MKRKNKQKFTNSSIVQYIKNKLQWQEKHTN